jgi:hypothetical protein
MGLATLCRDWLLKHVIEPKIAGRMEVTGKRRKHKQPLHDLKEKREYW